jgi:hypothetical protein
MENENNNLIDYAQPMLDAERALRATHHALLSRDYESAMAQAMRIIVEARAVYVAILHEKEKYDA